MFRGPGSKGQELASQSDAKGAKTLRKDFDRVKHLLTDEEMVDMGSAVINSWVWTVGPWGQEGW